MAVCPESSITEMLVNQFSPARSAGLHILVKFDWQTDACWVDIKDASACIYTEQPKGVNQEMVLYFSSEDCLRRLLAGLDQPLDAFMREDFRSNGYLMWAFQCLSAFTQDQ